MAEGLAVADVGEGVGGGCCWGEGGWWWWWGYVRG